MKMISVLHFLNTLARAGTEEHVLTLLRGLDRSRFRLSLVCTPSVAEKLGPDVPPDVRMVPLSLRKPTDLVAAATLAKILREQQVDILHSHQFFGSLFASPIGWLSRVPVVIETPHLREHWRKGWLKSRFIIDRLAGRFVDRYIAVSEANARYLIERKGLPPEKITVIPNGCDLRRFDPNRKAPTGWKRSLRFKEDDRVMVVLGRLEPQKGHTVLLDALPAVLKKCPDARVVCVGDGGLRPELERKAERLGLSDAVRFVGYRAHVEEWLALADFTVLPSLFEGLPLAAIESLAAGKPVVASAVDGTPEVVVDRHTGLTVPAGDAAALAHAICRLLREPERCRRFGAAGRRWVLERYDQRLQLRRTEALYLSALEDRGASMTQPAILDEPVTIRRAAQQSNTQVARSFAS